MSNLHRFAITLAPLLLVACASTPTAARRAPVEKKISADEAVVERAKTASTGPIARAPTAGTRGAVLAYQENVKADQLPCSRCTVDKTGRFRGVFRSDVETCGDLGAEMFYPIHNARIQVLSGAQAGQFFELDIEGDIPLDTPVEVKLSEEAEAKGWREAIIWVTDSTERPCASVVTLLRG